MKWLALLFCLSAHAGTVTLVWNPVPDVTGYSLYYGPSSRNYTNTVRGITTTNYTFTLPYGVFYFAATASCPSGLESGYSNEVSWTNAAPIPPPPIPPPPKPKPGKGRKPHLVSPKMIDFYDYHW